MRTAGVNATTVGAIVAASFVVLPLLGWPSVVRVAPILLFALLVVLVGARSWTWSSADWSAVGDWNPSPRVVRASAVLIGLLVFWFVYTRFRSAEINAIDFTVYYDRPNFQTLIGRPLYVESAGDPLRAYRTYLAVHAHWIMLPFALFYFVWASPLWVLALSVVAVIAGAIYTLRIVQWTGAGGLIGSASALAFVFNDNTARTLNYGFHTEILYAWFIPWMIYAGLLRRWRSFFIAALLCISVKEDAFLLLFGVCVTLFAVHGRTLSRIERFAVLPAPVVVALCNLAFYYGYLVPRLSATAAPFYANYWANYGPTALSAMVGMVRHPLDVLSSTLTSAFLTRVIVPHLYLPLLGWRWSLGIAPVVVLYGASMNVQLRSFGIYYAIVLVPFLVLGAADGARRLADRLGSHQGQARAIAAAVILAGALTAGMSNAGYSLRPWKPQVSAVPQMLWDLREERVVLVQSGLYPHAGYDERVQLLTNESLTDPRYAGAVLLLAPELSGYPLSTADLHALSQRPLIAQSASGLLVVRGAPQK